MSLYKRPNSRFYWMKFFFDGRLIQQSTKCKNRRDAETVESAYRTQLALGKVGIRPKKKPIPFKRAAEDYLELIKLNHAKKPASYLRISYSTLSLVKHFGSKMVDRIQKGDIEKFLITRSKEKSRKTGKSVTADTVNLELMALRTILRRLVSDGTLSENPAKDVKPLPANDRTFYVLSNEEEKRYLLACPQPLQDVATVILETGMRPQEVYELTRQCIDLDRGCLQIIGGKTQSSNRRVWLSPRAADVLRRRFDAYTGKYLFPKHDQDGAGPTYQLNDQHQTARKRVGIMFRLYDCRHTFASRMLEAGVDLLTLAAILGHASLDQVQRYAHPSENRKRDAILDMGKKAAKAV